MVLSDSGEGESFRGRYFQNNYSCEHTPPSFLGKGLGVRSGLGKGSGVRSGLGLIRRRIPRSQAGFQNTYPYEEGEWGIVNSEWVMVRGSWLMGDGFLKNLTQRRKGNGNWGNRYSGVGNRNCEWGNVFLRFENEPRRTRRFIFLSELGVLA